MASTAPQDNGGSLRKSIGLIELFTFWTCEPIRPAQAFQIGSAGGIIGKNPLKIGKRCWKAAGVHSGKLSPIHRIGNKPDRQGWFQLSIARSNQSPEPRRRVKTVGKSPILGQSGKALSTAHVPISAQLYPIAQLPRSQALRWLCRSPRMLFSIRRFALGCL